MSSDSFSSDSSCVYATDASIEDGTLTVTMLNTCCCIVGSGILALPLSVYHSSILVFTLLTLIFALMALASAYLVTRVVKQTQAFTISSVFGAALSCAIMSIDLRTWPLLPSTRFTWWNRLLTIIPEVLLVLNNVGVMIVEGKVLADALPSLFHQLLFRVSTDIVPSRGSFVWYLLPTPLLIYLSTRSRLSELVWTSLLGLGTIILLASVMVIKFAIQPPDERINLSEQSWLSLDLTSTGFWQTLSTLSMTYAYQYAVPVYYHELQRRSVTRMMLASTRAMILTALLYMLVGIMGYLSFGSEVTSQKVGGNILNAYADRDVLATVARTGFICHLICVFPLLSVMVRRSLHHLLTTLGLLSDIEAYHPSISLRVYEASFCILITYMIAYNVEGIAQPVQFIGALCGSFFMFILPGICGLILWRSSGSFSTPEYQPLLASSTVADDPHRRIYRIGSFLLMSFGFVVMFVGLQALFY